MRAKHFLPGMGLLALIAVMLFAFGCSDDSPTKSYTAGSDADPEYVMVQNQVNTFLDSTIQFFGNSFDNYNVMPNDDDEVENQYSPMYPTDTATYTYSEGWHEIYVTRSNAFFTDHIRDSLQFQVNNDPVEDASGADYMRLIRHWDFVTGEAYTVYTHTDMEGSLDLEFEDLDTDLCMINGSNEITVTWNYISEDTTIEATFEIDITVDDIGIAPVPSYGWASGCPSSGTINYTIVQTYTIEVDEVSDPIEKTWTATVTWEDGTASVRVYCGNYRWTYTRDVCDVVGS
ncbi:MAG: hypothetical protein JW763_03675 [candidate division Zixibacteria bacterium]|nr:hypothetical protein [candidate division Zixibacteria bacterium]